MASIASGAIAFPIAQALDLRRLFQSDRRSQPEVAAATLVACASIARLPGFNVSATASDDPLLARAVALAASDEPIEAKSIVGDPPPAPRPIIAWAPVLGLVVALGGLAAAISAVAGGRGLDPATGVAIVIALFSAFFLSAAAAAVDDRAGRLDPADVVVRAMIDLAIPAIRSGAGPERVERLLAPLLPPESSEISRDRLAA